MILKNYIISFIAGYYQNSKSPSLEYLGKQKKKHTPLTINSDSY